LLLGIACSQPPAVSGVDPSEGLPGSTLQVVGERFGDEVSLALAPSAGGDRVALDVTARSAVVIGATVPEAAPPGDYDLIVTVPGHEVRVKGGYVVRAVPVDEPCGKLYTANTAINAITGEVIVDRFYKDGKRETLRTKLDDITQVEYERVAVADGQLCSVVYLRTEEGGRFRFSDDIKVDLKQRAYKLGQEIGKSVKVTREDPAPATPEVD
jgi:hypothetical protein